MPFIGIHEIESEVAQGDYIQVTFKESRGEERPPIMVSSEVLEASRTDKPSDSSLLRDKRADIVCTEIMKIFVKHNVKIHSSTGDFHHITSKLANMINNSIDRAEELRWGCIHDLDILSIHMEILKSEQNKSQDAEGRINSFQFVAFAKGCYHF